MPESVSPIINYQPVSENLGTFVIEPLESGYGITLGNALRRVLLSSLPGAAVTEVKIDGVQHEFSTIPHMKEDVLEFLLNVKGIRLRRLSDRPDKLTLEASGERLIRAGDIAPSADYEIVNPEHHLATLDSPDATLNVEFTVEVGHGYVAAGHADGRPLGVLTVDAIFTPVRRVNYRVEKTRVEERSNYDRLILEVLTDGTISPEEAVADSARLLIGQFSIFNQLAQAHEETADITEKPPLESEKADLPLERMGLSMRTLNALRRGGITSAGALMKKSKDELLDLRNFGQKSWDEVQVQLAEMGLIEEPQTISREAEGADEEAEGEPKELTPEEAEIEEMRRKLQERFTVREEK